MQLDLANLDRFENTKSLSGMADHNSDVAAHSDVHGKNCCLVPLSDAVALHPGIILQRAEHPFLALENLHIGTATIPCFVEERNGLKDKAGESHKGRLQDRRCGGSQTCQIGQRGSLASCQDRVAPLARKHSNGGVHGGDEADIDEEGAN